MNRRDAIKAVSLAVPSLLFPQRVNAEPAPVRTFADNKQELSRCVNRIRIDDKGHAFQSRLAHFDVDDGIVVDLFVFPYLYNIEMNPTARAWYPMQAMIWEPYERVFDDAFGAYVRTRLDALAAIFYEHEETWLVRLDKQHSTWYNPLVVGNDELERRST